MTYATVEDLQIRLNRTLSEREITLCTALLEDAGAIIDSYNSNAPEGSKKVVSCNMVKRVILASMDSMPMGATQGTMSALGYSQTWTLGAGGGSGELYLSKNDKKLLGVGNKIGSRSPLEDLA